MMPLSKWKIRRDFICRELSQLEHIKIWMKNWSIFTEIQSIFQKYDDVIICKLKFWVRRQLWWRHELIEGQMRQWNHISRLILYQDMKKKIGVILHPKALQWILYRHVFYRIYAMYYKSSHARTFTLKRRQSWRHGLIWGFERTLAWTDAHFVINGHKEINMVSNCLE